MQRKITFSVAHNTFNSYNCSKITAMLTNLWKQSRHSFYYSIQHIKYSVHNTPVGPLALLRNFTLKYINFNNAPGMKMLHTSRNMLSLDKKIPIAETVSHWEGCGVAEWAGCNEICALRSSSLYQRSVSPVKGNRIFRITEEKFYL
jgi:hypothetical protein